MNPPLRGRADSSATSVRGFGDVRAKVSGQMSDEVASHLSGIIRSMSGFLAAIMDPDIGRTRGARGGLAAGVNVVVEPGDEVTFFSPPWFFYEALILGAHGKPVKLRVKPSDFDLDVDAIAAAISPQTRAVLINTPHNPTGRIFGEDTLGALASVLEDASARNRRPIYLISDEAYSRILFDGNRMITPGASYARSP